MSFRFARILLTGLAFAALSFLVLTGCSRSIVSTNFKTPEFALTDLRTAPSLLVVSPEVRVLAFKKSYRRLFKNDTAMGERLSKKILDSLSRTTQTFAAPSLPDSALRSLLVEKGAKYVIRVQTVTIKDSSIEIPDVLVPGISGAQNQQGGTSSNCIVTLDVEVLDSTLTRRYAFTVWSMADVLLYAYKTGVLNGLDAAARNAARHLRGP